MVIGSAEKRAQDYLKNAGHINDEIAMIRKSLAVDRKKMQNISKVLLTDMTQLPQYNEYVKHEETHIERLQAERDHALFLIDKIESDRYRTVLRLLYFDRMTAEEAAEKMHYCVTHINRLKAGALSVMAKIMEETDTC